MAKIPLKIEQATPDLFPRLVQYSGGKFYDGSGNLIDLGGSGQQGFQGPTGPQGYSGGGSFSIGATGPQE